ncbi:hypothetical protein E8E15_001261 [Penicillium rubens]|nr:hypothetical protein E8E15_001261 [Penicillium rubens]
MKSTTFWAIFYGVSLAQNSIIGTPTAGQKLTRDSKTVVQVERPNSLTGSAEVVVVIGISSCVSIVCRPADEAMCTILYLIVPNSIATGNAQINIAHVALVGAERFPYQDAEPYRSRGLTRTHRSSDSVHVASTTTKSTSYPVF